MCKKFLKKSEKCVIMALNLQKKRVNILILQLL